MIRQHKFILGFSIIYWLCIILGITLMSVSLQKVPVGYYGLRASVFTSYIQTSYYSHGLYDVGVGYRFILFPSQKQYALDQQVAVINNDLQTTVITYSIAYRINPNSIYDIFIKMGLDYEPTLLAATNNILSGIVVGLPQNETRTTLQSLVTTEITTNANNKIVESFGSGIVVEAFWVQQVTFSNEIQADYQASSQLSSSYEQAYESTQVQYQKTLLQVAAVQRTIKLIRQKFKFEVDQARKQRLAAVLSTELSQMQTRQTTLSSNYYLRRIWTVFDVLVSTTTPPGWCSNDSPSVSLHLMLLHISLKFQI